MGNERSCIRSFINVLDAINPAEYASVDQLADDLADRFKAHLAVSGCAPCTYVFAERRMRKVRQYLLGLGGTSVPGEATDSAEPSDLRPAKSHTAA